MNKANKKFIVLNETDSTNNYAKQLILSNPEEGTVVMAQYQKSGKGQQGNSWESESGKNMLASIILYPSFLYAGDQFMISKIVSLAILDTLKSKIKNVSIKWPNDIYVHDKKIAGILIENTIKGNNLDSSILGIGLNLNQTIFMSNAPNPVSLQQITGEEYNIEKVADEVLTSFSRWYKKLKMGDHSEINATYYTNMFRGEMWSLYSKNDVRFEAKIIGIGEFGKLRLQKRDGSIEEYLFKEVEFVL